MPRGSPEMWPRLLEVGALTRAVVRQENPADVLCCLTHLPRDLLQLLGQYFIFVTYFLVLKGAPVAQWVKRWPTDLADQVRSSLKVKSSHP